ncbi:MAG: MFS transporter [Chitinophagales bacterium]|nr:MFS transporter [Chitinophagales bacterium]MBP8754933.1 MFS transporter [Chitinophagales bacterium]MBP9188670.1 MFS transporter [Chitinophagales bacterium]
MTQSTSKNSGMALITLISVFFFWGFVAASNDILIPVFKSALNLEQWQSQMISFAFYVAYTIGSLVYFILTSILKKDILNSLGYRNGLALGLIISALGTLLFIPASNSQSFFLLISGLFIVGLGFSLQQIAANPLAINMGDPEKGNMRLSLAGGINNVGTTIGPVIVAFAIFGGLPTAETTMNLEAVKIPYLILGAAFIIAAIFIKLSSVPDHIGEKNVTHTGFSQTIKKPQVWMGMIAIFVYVGVEVSTASNLPEFMRQHLNTGEHEIAPYVSLFWASLMIGRWTSAAGAFNLPELTKMRLSILLPFLAFGIFLIVNIIAGHSVSQFYPYLFLVIVLATADAISEGHPVKQLLLYSFLGIISLIVGMFSSGLISVFAFISVGLFCSTLWPCIFTLSIAGLGDKTNTASSLLIMMIMGGGIISLIQGFLSDDALLGIQYSYIVGVCCFAYLVFFAWKIAGMHKAKGVGIIAEK